MNSIKTKIKPFLNPQALALLLFFMSYTLLTFLTPQTASSIEEFYISPRNLFWIRITIIAPYFISWFAAFYSMVVLRTISISSGRYSKMSSWLSRGFGLLLFGSVFTVLGSSVQSFLSHHTYEYTEVLVIVINYIRAFTPLLAFVFMYIGINKFKTSKEYSFKSEFIQAIIVSIVLGIPYILLVFTNTNRQIGFSSESPATYYISDTLIFFTIILPVLASWFIGMFTAIKLSKKFLTVDLPSRVKSFINGLFLVIFSSMILQAILSLGTERLYEFGLVAVLILVYILLISQTFGYILTARGVSVFTNKTFK